MTSDDSTGYRCHVCGKRHYHGDLPHGWTLLNEYGQGHVARCDECQPRPKTTPKLRRKHRTVR